MNKIFKALCALSALVLAGCATHTSQTQKMRSHWAVGDVSAAELEVKECALDSGDGGDALIWNLESGAVARANADFKNSIGQFSSARKRVEVYEAEAEIRLGQETAAIFTNQSYIPYKGYNYDKIMMSVYQALNHIETKNFDEAAVELKLLENFQQNAESANAARIEKEMKSLREESAKRERLQKSQGAQNVSVAVSDKRTQSALKKIYGNDFSTNAGAQQAKGVYVNPFAYWLTGLYFANRPEDMSDKNKAADMFRFASEMLGNSSKAVMEDAAMANDLANGTIKKVPAVTYVVYETGMAPVRMQVRIDLPLTIVAKNVPYVGVNFPYLEYNKSYRKDLVLTANGASKKMDTLADMDEIIKREFYNELPYVVTKTLISAGVKAGIEYAAVQAAGDYGWIVSIASGIYQAAMNDADLRTWTTLPKQIRIARFPTPANGVVNVDGTSVKVVPNQTNVIFAKRMDANGKLILRTFDFSDKK